MLSLIEIKYKVEQLANKINVPAKRMPTYGTSKNDGTPYIEVDDSYYYYLALERDVKCINRQTPDLEELLYWIFHDITFTMAMSYELEHRVSNVSRDHRKTIFAYQLDMLNKLNPLWKKRREQEIIDILKETPYR